jgi:segregation and condensation protein A
MLGFESQESDFLQVEKRIPELEKLIESGNSLSFRSLLVASSSRSSIVVTLLALLEMARMGRLKIFQEERFGELRFKSAV